MPRGRLTGLRLGALGLALVIALAIGMQPSVAPRQVTSFGGPPSDFNYYILALTWTPGFCATHQESEECGQGLTFGLHGLWPQVDARTYPSFCNSQRLSHRVREKYRSLYPSPTMIDHEWSKHGTCSGLSPQAYFDLSDRIRDQVIIPASLTSPRLVGAEEGARVKRAFLAANPGMKVDGVRTRTADGLLTEVRICVTRTGAFRSCT